MATSLIKIIIAAGCLCLAWPVFADNLLPDPTKPAVDIPSASETGEGVANVAAPVQKKQGLQSVIISSRHRAAVINGKTFSLGDKVGDATLVEVRSDSVVLQGTQGKHVMELFPEVHFTKAESQLHEKSTVPAIANDKVLMPKAAHPKRNTAKPVKTEKVKEKRESL